MRACLHCAAVALVLALGILSSGCDVDSATADVLVLPTTTTIVKGQSIRFDASNGYDYRWKLDQPGYGTLSTLIGPTTVYTSRYTPAGTNAIATQILTVTATILANDRGGGTNSYTETASAYIIHVSP